MELKLSKNAIAAARGVLLIVPYGIETFFVIRKKNFQQLLIVPYGIETQCPCGSGSSCRLLIVPYGIETTCFRGLSVTTSTFNRTLWN